jgi:hypothetical protein
MLIRITDSCRMGCSHCMVDAKPSGAHMSEQTYLDALGLTGRIGLPIVLLSGGEPADHPDVLGFVRLAKRAGMTVHLLSNGMFLQEDPARRQAILDAVDAVQVTNDPRYYPNRVDQYDHPKVAFERRLRQLSPFGRAAGSRECSRQAPLCFNVRSLTRALGSIQPAVWDLARRMRFCVPSINTDGTVVCGEAPSCSPVGQASDSLEDLTARIVELRCSRCGLVRNLDTMHRNAIGE